MHQVRACWATAIGRGAGELVLVGPDSCPELCLWGVNAAAWLPLPAYISCQHWRCTIKLVLTSSEPLDSPWGLINGWKAGQCGMQSSYGMSAAAKQAGCDWLAGRQRHVPGRILEGLAPCTDCADRVERGEPGSATSPAASHCSVLDKSSVLQRQGCELLARPHALLTRYCSLLWRAVAALWKHLAVWRSGRLQTPAREAKVPDA